MRHGRLGKHIHHLEEMESRQLMTVINVLPQPIALQTPHINALLRHTVGGAPLSDSNGNFSIDALFNTASPGLVLSNETSDFLGVQREQVSSANAIFAHNHSGGATNVPNLHWLMFFGPNPIDPTLPDNTPPVSLSLGASNTTASLLLDTAAATSMISLAKAASLGVTYAPGTFGTSGAALVGVPASQQFRLTVQSFAGPITLAGFFADSLTIQSDAGPIVFTHAPLLV